MDKFEKLLDKKKKGGKELSDVERDAKMSVVKHLKSLAGDEMSNRLKGMKKVSVSSDSPEGLKAGLEKAEEMVDKMKGESEDEESEEMAEHDSDEDLDESGLDAKLEKLMKLKESKSKKS